MTRDDTLLTRRIAVIGLAATGLATARILSERGATVTVYDGKPEADLDAVRVVEAKALPNVRLRFGVAEPDWSETDLVVPSPGVPKWARPIAGAVENGVPVWSEIEVAYRLAVAPILAITGTNGKTTTTALVGAICREAGLVTFVAGNIAEDDGKRTPLIVAAVECPKDGVIVAEISSFQLEHVHAFKPKVAAWLNLSVDHMDRYASMEEYAQAKAKIFAAQDETDFAVINAEDEAVMESAANIGSGRRMMFFDGQEQLFSAQIAIENNIRHNVPSGVFARLQYSRRRNPEAKSMLRSNVYTNLVQIYDANQWSEILLYNIKLPGYFNLENIMAGILICYAIGISLQTIERAVKEFRGVAHRMEFVADVRRVRYINNSMCTNPAAVQASVSAIETPLVAIVGGIHKGGDLTPMYESLAGYACYVVVIGASKHEIHAGLLAAGMDEANITDAETLPDAVRIAASVATGGDTVMLVPGCASFDMFTGFEERGAVFRAAVARLLSASAPLSPRPFLAADGRTSSAREKGEPEVTGAESFGVPASPATLHPTNSPFSLADDVRPSAARKGRGDRGAGTGDGGEC